MLESGQLHTGGPYKKIGDYPKGSKEVTRVLYQVSFASSIVNAGDVLE